MDAEPPLDYLLDTTGGPTPGREELQEILARSHSRRNRLAATGMLLALVVGGAGGWLVRAGRSSRGTALAAGGDTGASTTIGPLSAAAAGRSATAVAGSSGYKLTKLFVRMTADGVTIRAFQPPTPVFTQVPGCPSLPQPVFPGLITEVSTSEVASQAGGFMQNATAPFKSDGISTVGGAEGAPVWVVTAEVDSTVAQVRATFPDGKTDQMVPVKGWAALAHVAPAATVDSNPPTGSFQALDGSGKVIATSPFPSLATLQPPKGVPVPAPGATITVPANGAGVAGGAGGGVSVSSGVATATAPASPVLVPTTIAGSSAGAAVATTVAAPPCPLIVPAVPAATTTTTISKGTG